MTLTLHPLTAVCKQALGQAVPSVTAALPVGSSEDGEGSLSAGWAGCRLPDLLVWGLGQIRLNSWSVNGNYVVFTIENEASLSKHLQIILSDNVNYKLH